MPFSYGGSSFCIVIPARFSSTRFPGKPLIDLCGSSMIQRVWSICASVLGEENCYVATDSELILRHCNEHNMQCLETSEGCLTGTDRVAEVADRVGADIIINVQGDEPLIDENDILRVMDASARNPRSLVNAMCPIEDEAEFRSFTVPKVVYDEDHNLLYMSRSPIPINKEGAFSFACKQVCIYAFPKHLLMAFASKGKKAKFEKIEDIEILRFLEMGYQVKMVEVGGSSVAVDTPADAEKVRKIIAEMSN